MDDSEMAVHQHEAQASTEQRPTMEDLWRRHPEIRNRRMIEAPGIPYIQVAFAFSGFPVTQEVFDAVLMALNRLAGTHYTQADIAGVRIASPEEGEGV